MKAPTKDDWQHLTELWKEHCEMQGELIAKVVEENKQLKRRISELEDGACRFNCRKEREAFVAGYRACHEYIPVQTNDLEKMIAYRFSEWLKERDEP